MSSESYRDPDVLLPELRAILDPAFPDGFRGMAPELARWCWHWDGPSEEAARCWFCGGACWRIEDRTGVPDGERARRLDGRRVFAPLRARHARDAPARRDVHRLWRHRPRPRARPRRRVVHALYRRTVIGYPDPVRASLAER
jgi:hypothetical protein